MPTAMVKGHLSLNIVLSVWERREVDAQSTDCFAACTLYRCGDWSALGSHPHISEDAGSSVISCQCHRDQADVKALIV